MMAARLSPLAVATCAALSLAPLGAQTVTTNMSLLAVNSITTAAPTANATQTNMLGLPVATEQAIKDMLYDDAKQRAHMWSIYDKLFEPIPGGAARFETFYNVGRVTFSKADVSAVVPPEKGPAGLLFPDRVQGMVSLYDATAHKHVRDNKLYLASTLRDLIKNGAADPDRQGAKKIPDFPASSIVLKCVFEPLANEADKKTHYWFTDKAGQAWILLAMHATTREQPSWTWATLYVPRTPGERVGQGRKLDEMPDDIRKRIGSYEHVTATGEKMTGVFLNYVMDTGFDYYNSAGDTSEKNERSCFNPYLESDQSVGPRFAKSNCISCHDQAKFAMDYDPFSLRDAAGTPKGRDDNGVMALTDDNRPRTRVSGKTPSNHYSNPGTVSTDFLWSVTRFARE